MLKAGLKDFNFSQIGLDWRPDYLEIKSSNTAVNSEYYVCDE